MDTTARRNIGIVLECIQNIQAVLDGLTPAIEELQRSGTPEELNKVKKILERTQEMVAKMSVSTSSLPGVREFLEERGLTNIFELDDPGRREFREYIRVCFGILPQGKFFS